MKVGRSDRGIVFVILDAALSEDSPKLGLLVFGVTQSPILDGFLHGLLDECGTCSVREGWVMEYL